MNLEQALATVKAAGYRVSKPKAKAVAAELNAVGKPYSPQYDPNYRMKYRTPPLKRAQNVGEGIGPEKWASMCLEARLAWNAWMAREAEAPLTLAVAAARTRRRSRPGARGGLSDTPPGVSPMNLPGGGARERGAGNRGSVRLVALRVPFVTIRDRRASCPT